MTFVSTYLAKCQRRTGLDYAPVAEQLEQAYQQTNPNDIGAVSRFLRNIFDVTDRHEAGQQLPILFPRPVPKY